MNGGHDLGGMDGLGPIQAEAETEEPVFHYEWEKTAFALTLATGSLGQWNIDTSRFARERQHPVAYLSNTYYQNWLAGLETLLLEAGMVTAEELRTCVAAQPAPADLRKKVLTPAKVAETLGRGGPASHPVDTVPEFAIGQRVRVINAHPTGHTRAPRYVRGHVGEVVLQHGGHIFADANAAGDRRGAHLYSVRFLARELWGATAAARDSVIVDLWEPHLETVT